MTTNITNAPALATDGDPRPTRLVAFIETLDGFAIRARGKPYNHMGATITDAALQAQWNYKRVVLPRARRVRDRYPEAKTTTGFSKLITDTEQAHKILNTRHTGKVQIARALATLLVSEGVETEERLCTWLSEGKSRERLLAIDGVGPATAAYLALLVGDPNAVKMDIHLRRFLHLAEIEAVDDGAAVVAAAARILQATPAELDRALWHYQVQQRERRRRRRPT